MLAFASGCILVRLSLAIPCLRRDKPSDPTSAQYSAEPWSRCRPSAMRLEALTSPPRLGSQDFPTVPGYPATAAVSFPDQSRGSRHLLGLHAV